MTDHVRYIRSPFTLHVLFSFLTYCRCFTHGSIDLHDRKRRKKKKEIQKKKWRRKKHVIRRTYEKKKRKKKKKREREKKETHSNERKKKRKKKNEQEEDSQCGKKALRVCTTIVFLCTKSVVNQTQLCVCVCFFFFCLHPLFAKKKRNRANKKAN